jgi:hypothetical protein
MATDLMASINAKRAELEAADRAAKAKGLIVGRYITHPYADSHATYRVVSVTKTKAKIAHFDDGGDAWVLPAWGKAAIIPLSKVEANLAQRDAWDRLFSERNDWWSQQPVGSTVHYDNGFRQYVRGIIVEHEGKKQMKPIALVGEWSGHDLPRRNQDGTVYYPYHVQQIREGKPYQPNNMVERPDYVLRGDHPATMQPISLEPPAQSDAEARLALRTQQHAALVEALKYEPVHDNPEATIAAIDSAVMRMLRAYTLMKSKTSGDGVLFDKKKD